MNRSELIILLIAAVISVAKWMMERGKEGAKPTVDSERRRRLSEMRQEKAEQNTGSPSANAEEERLRKFMEALGLPHNAPPPVYKPVPPSASVPPPIQPAAPPERKLESKPIASPSLERVPAKKEPPAPALAPVPTTAPAASPIMPSAEADAAEAAAFAIRPSRQPLETIHARRSQEKLVNFSNRRALRSAFVMSEILGQPKGLR